MLHRYLPVIFFRANEIAGHMLGGTIWKAVKDETDIIYAIDFNNEKSRHLNGAAFDACIRPRLLIIDVSNALYTHVGLVAVIIANL